jgi:hypothetical protein
MPLKFKNGFAAIKSLVMRANVRLAAHYNVGPLKADILENGLLTPVTVFNISAKENEVIRGHRRVTALLEIAIEDPKAFKKLCPNGIPVTILEGITYDEAQTMKVDDTNYQPLTDPFEVQMCSNVLFKAELNEKQVVLRMAGILDRIHPPNAKNRKSFAEIQSSLRIAEEAGMAKEVKIKQAELDDAIFKQRRGKIQNLHAAFRCPNIVMAALEYKATGAIPDDFKKEYLPPNLNYDQVKNQLWKAFLLDLELDKGKGGSLKYNKRTPGPNFLAKWGTICKTAKDLTAKQESGDTETRAKAQSGKTMQESKWMSTGFTQLTNHHSGQEINTDLLDGYDETAYFAELLKERSPKEWDDCLALAKGLEEGIAAERKEAASK